MAPAAYTGAHTTALAIGDKKGDTLKSGAVAALSSPHGTVDALDEDEDEKGGHRCTSARYVLRM